MPDSAPALPLLERRARLLRKHGRLSRPHFTKRRQVHFVPRHEKAPPALAAQVIGLGRRAKRKWQAGFHTEHHQVGEVALRRRVSGRWFGVAEKAALGNYGVDSANDEPSRGQEEVSSIILFF